MGKGEEGRIKWVCQMEEGLEPVGELLGDRAGIGEGVFILLFILVWRAVAGPSEPGVENKVKLALSPLPMPEGPAVHAHPTVREAPPGSRGSRGRGSGADHLQYLQFRQNLVASGPDVKQASSLVLG